MATIFLIIGIAFVLSIVPVAFLLLRAYLKARGPRVIVCPETETSEVVAVDPGRAAWAAVRQDKNFRLISCTRWPGREDCGRDCLSQIESAPDGCLVRERLTRWYQGAVCAVCRKPFEEIHWFDHKPGLVTLDRKIMSWDEVPPRDLPEILRTHLQLCWDCQVSERFRERFPDMVVDDPRPAQPSVSGRRASA